MNQERTWSQWASSWFDWKNVAIGGYASMIALLSSRGYTPIQIAKLHALVFTGALDIISLLSGNPNSSCNADGSMCTLSGGLLNNFGKKSRRKRAMKSKSRTKKIKW